MKTILHLVCMLVFPLIGYSFPIDGKLFSNKSVSQITFEENKGQVWDFQGNPQPQVKFACGQRNMSVFLMTSGIAYQFTRTHYPDGFFEGMPKESNRKKLQELIKGIRIETFRTDMVMLGSNLNPNVTKEGKSMDYHNYYNREVLDVYSYTKITYHEVYPGIDWVVYAAGESIKYDFIVHPGADPSLIRMRYQNHESLALNNEGNLIIKTSMGTVTEHSPVSYQGSKKIETAFSLNENVISFNLGGYDKLQTLRIDPLLVWGTYFGDVASDDGRACTSDGSGNVYMAGSTQSTLNIASGGYQTNYGGMQDAYVIKYNSSGVKQWATFYGGNDYDVGEWCTIDGGGNVYLSGTTESSTGIAAGGHQSNLGGETDAFLVKFSSIGTRLWATYYGGNYYESGYSCATDASGNIYLAGDTRSTNNISSGGHQNTSGGDYDAFLAKFDGSGVRQWATFYGGSNDETGYSCFAAPTGEVYLAGKTESSSNISSGGFQNSLYGSRDAFLVKFDGTGARQWGTYYGGNDDDIGYGSTVDGAGNVYLVGSTRSGVNISSTGHQNTLGGKYDGLAVKFTAAGARVWSTYYGGLENDFVFGCTCDANNNLYLTGYTESSNNIESGGLPYSVNTGFDLAAFITKLDANGIRQWGSNYGGPNQEDARSCNVSVSGDLYVCGRTSSTVGISLNGQQNTSGGDMDAFLIKISTCNPPPAPAFVIADSVLCPNAKPVYSVSTQPDITGYKWTLPPNWSGASVTNTISTTAGSSGAIKVAATGSCGVNSSVLNVTVTPTPTITINFSEPTYCAGTTATLTASGASTYTWTGWGTSASQTVNVQSPTVFEVTGGPSACSGKQTYTVIPDMTAAFNFTVNGMTANFHLVNSSCSSFLWDFANGNSNNINTDPTTTYATAGTYSVCLKCQNVPDACQRCIAITVPGNMIGGVGITEVDNDRNFNVYPNPASDKFVIETTSETYITIYNSLGEIVLQKQLILGKNILDLNGQAEGVYFIKAKGRESAKTLLLTK